MERPSGAGFSAGSESAKRPAGAKLEVKSYGPAMESPSPQKKAQEVVKIAAADLSSEEALRRRIAEASGESMETGHLGMVEVQPGQLDLAHMGPEHASLDTEFEEAFAQAVPENNNGHKTHAAEVRQMGEDLLKVMDRPKEDAPPSQAEGKWG